MKIYIPLFYSEKVKRPGQNYFLYHIIAEDFALLLLTFTLFSPYKMSNAIGLFLLQMAFWCIYEIGYIENDATGDKYEDKAVLSYNYGYYKCSFPWWQPWMFASILSFSGTAILNKDLVLSSNLVGIIAASDHSSDLLRIIEAGLLWLIFLLVLRLLFHIYNHLNKQSRVWFYLVLQSCRYCGFLLILTTNIIGIMLLVSKIITRSIQYILYRYTGGNKNNWPKIFPRHFFCLLIYFLLLGAIALNNRELSIIFNYQVLCIVIFCFIRGSKNFKKVLTQCVHVRQDGSNQIT